MSNRCDYVVQSAFIGFLDRDQGQSFLQLWGHKSWPKACSNLVHLEVPPQSGFDVDVDVD
jgi:hypothetical protein